MKFKGMHWMLAAAMVAGVGCNREEPVAEQTQSATQPAERQDDAWITTSLQGRFYADDAVKMPLFSRFLRDKHMGGLMITEPDYGTDALNMQTTYVEHDDHYHIEGVKHWGGLTGWADLWLVTARRQGENGLLRDIDFFICDIHQPEQHIVVEGNSRLSKGEVQMLLRGQSLVGYSAYPDNAVQAFVKEAASTGLRLPSPR